MYDIASRTFSSLTTDGTSRAGDRRPTIDARTDIYFVLQKLECPIDGSLVACCTHIEPGAGLSLPGSWLLIR